MLTFQKKTLNILKGFQIGSGVLRGKRQYKKLNTLVNALKAYYKEHDHLWVHPELEVEGENIMSAMQYYRARL